MATADESPSVSHHSTESHDATERRRAEEAALESAAILRALAETAAAMLIYQGDRMRYVNSGLEALTGYTREELLAMDFWDVIHPDFRELVKERGLARQRGERVTPGYEVKFLRKNGEERWAEVTARAIEFEGEPAALGTAFDITERRRAEEEIRLLLSITQAINTADNFQSTLEAVLREVCEATGWDYGEAWLSHPDGTVLECNPAWYSATDALTRFRLVSEQTTFPPGAGLPGRVWLSKQPEWIENLWTRPDTVFFRAGAAQEAGLKAGLGIPIAANGEGLAVLVFFMPEPREEDRRLLQLISAVAQQLGGLFQRKRAEEALRDSKLLLEGTFASLDEAVFVVDPNTRTIIACNSAAERVFGYSEKEMIGRNTEFLHVDRATYEDFGRKLFPALDADGVFHTEYQVRRKDESVLLTEHTVTEIVDDSGQRTGLVSVLRDVTEHKRAEAALRESDERYRALVESAFEGIVISKAGKILEANESFARMFGYELPEVIGLSPVEMTTPESAELISNNVQFGFEKPYEITGIKKDGATISIEVIGKNCVYQGREARITAFRDITRRKLAEEQLQVAREELEGKVERQLLRRNPYGLTFRELTVLHLAAAGKSAKEIGIDLGISPFTAQKHLSNILAKMDVASRTEAVARGLREGLLD